MSSNSLSCSSTEFEDFCVKLETETEQKTKNEKSLVDSFKLFEEKLFEILKTEDELVPATRLIQGIQASGIRKNDPRLSSLMTKLSVLQIKLDKKLNGKDSLYLDKEQFKDCIKDNLMLIKTAFTADLVVPQFTMFCYKVDELFEHSKNINDGKIASYIPQLKRVSAKKWGVSICTVDGQRHSNGDVNDLTSIQSTGKPFYYALAINDLGPKAVHKYIGHEPSGECFNQIKLGANNKPHNPLINAGAIVIASLLQNKLNLADRFDHVTEEFKRLTGGERVGFNNAIFLSEKEAGYRNYALSYYLKENGCFPEGVNLQETLDFYFQLCSIEMTCESASVAAATLANGGICPITGDKVLSSTSVRNTLSLMHSCGMYGFSGQWAFTIGLPAKSGISGLIVVVIPNVMGIALWSPLLDNHGNSVRGVHFCEKLVSLFNFHNYDNLKHTIRKLDPRCKPMERKGQQVVTLLFGAYSGDLTALRRQYLLGVDMDQDDYDGRTALHIAAAEGHLDCVEFLLETCQVEKTPLDRWGFSPADDAIKFNHNDIVEFINNFDETAPRKSVLERRYSIFT